jgi:hypothetical protein
VSPLISMPCAATISLFESRSMSSPTMIVTEPQDGRIQTPLKLAGQSLRLPVHKIEPVPGGNGININQQRSLRRYRSRSQTKQKKQEQQQASSPPSPSPPPHATGRFETFLAG